MTNENDLSLEELQAMFLLCLRELLPSARRYKDADLITKAGKAKFEDATNQLFDFVELGCKVKLDRSEYLAMLTQVLGCLQRYLQSIQVPFTITTAITHIHLLPFAVDIAFPNYAAAGFLRTIISPKNLHMTESEFSSSAVNTNADLEPAVA